VLDQLRNQVLAANLALPAHELVKLTWGNVSGIDRGRGLIAIKASGVPYERLTAADIIFVDLDGNVVSGERRPSTDTPTHLALYQAFAGIGGIVHTHSTFATAWAQAEREIPMLGTTHADFASGPIPVTRALSGAEIDDGYESATGAVVIEAIGEHCDRLPAALVRGHGPFCWGRDPAAAVENAVTLEEVAHLAWLSNMLNPDVGQLDSVLREKHFERKHGAHAYYGQG
jgi:L-ribulose-5-phosphate 4-epimerase